MRVDNLNLFLNLEPGIESHELDQLDLVSFPLLLLLHDDLLKYLIDSLLFILRSKVNQQEETGILESSMIIEVLSDFGLILYVPLKYRSPDVVHVELVIAELFSLRNHFLDLRVKCRLILHLPQMIYLVRVELEHL